MAGALREVLARFGITADTRQLDSADRRVSSTTRSLRAMVAAAGGAATLYAMRRFVSGSIAIGDAVDKTSRSLNLGRAEFQSYEHAARLSGMETNQFTATLGILSQRALMASRGNREAKTEFDRLGVSVTDAEGRLRPLRDLLPDVAAGFSEQVDPNERAGMAMRLMGEQGRRMLPFLLEGRDGVRAMLEEVEQLGGGASEDFINQSVEMTDNLERFRVASLSLRSGLLTQLLPTMTRMVQWLTRTTAALSRSGVAAAAARPILVALGVAAAAAGVSAAVAWGGAVAPIALAALAATALYLAIDDVYTAFKGGRSVTTEFLDSLGYLVGLPALGTQMFRGFRTAIQTYFDAIAKGLSPTEALIIGLRAMGTAGDNVTRWAMGVMQPILGVIATIQTLVQNVDYAVDAFARLAAITQPAFGLVSAVRSGIGIMSPRGTGATQLTGGRAPVQYTTERGIVATPIGSTSRSVSVDSHAQTQIHVHAAENPEATARVVRTELDRREAANHRAILDAVEPARAGGA